MDVEPIENNPIQTSEKQVFDNRDKALIDIEDPW